MTYAIGSDGSAYGIGDRVQFNDLCSARELRGSLATVVRKSRGRLTVRLDEPAEPYVKEVDGIKQDRDTTVPFSIVNLVG